MTFTSLHHQDISSAFKMQLMYFSQDKSKPKDKLKSIQTDGKPTLHVYKNQTYNLRNHFLSVQIQVVHANQKHHLNYVHIVHKDHIQNWCVLPFYADDTQLYVHLSQRNASAASDKLNRRLQDVKEWMSASKLKLHADKTEFILFGSKKQRERLNVCFLIDILDNPLHPTESVRSLGVWFECDFSFSKHVQNVCKSCFIQLRDFRNIRQLLTHDAAVSVVNAFVSSRLDYCNSLFRSLSKVNLHRLQSIQNSAARIVTNSCRYTQITPVLRKLHWLPIQVHSKFKLATLVYKFIHAGFPKYFAPHSFIYRTTYNTRHS